MPDGLVPILVVAVILGLPLLWLIGTYNGLVRLRQHVRESWSGIDTELKRRYDLIPNLVETVKGYASHEKQVLEEVTRARQQAVASTGSAGQQAADENLLVGALKHLFAVAEGYPDLKASGNFLHLLTHNAADVNPLIGWFGRLRTEEGRVGLKKGGIMPIFSAARVLALRHGISARSTPERLEAARPHLGTLGDKVPSLIDAHKILLGAILNQQLRDLDTGTALSNAVAPKEMSAAQLDRMKWAVQQTHAVPDLLGTPHPV